MKRRLCFTGQIALVQVLLCCFLPTGMADEPLVTSEAAETEIWVGQKAPFYVKVRGKGPFKGATSFSIPHIPQTVIVNVGSPVVSSEEIGDVSWFVQTHEFALFTQAEGTIEVPSFEVRFTDHDGFTGPEVDHTEQVPPISFEVKRPPDSADLGFLVTTDNLEVTETWDPQPGDVKQGDVFHRTITQEADQVTAMALAPPPTTAPSGVRVYTDEPQLKDDTQRGEFRGTRSDTITYLLEKPGMITIPAIKYTWWNPDSQEYGSKTLPAVTFDVAPLPQPAATAESTKTDFRWVPWLIALLGLCGLALWQRHRLSSLAKACLHWLNPPEVLQPARLSLRGCGPGRRGSARISTRPRASPRA